MKLKRAILFYYLCYSQYLLSVQPLPIPEGQIQAEGIKTTKTKAGLVVTTITTAMGRIRIQVVYAHIAVERQHLHLLQEVPQQLRPTTQSILFTLILSRRLMMLRFHLLTTTTLRI